MSSEKGGSEEQGHEQHLRRQEHENGSVGDAQHQREDDETGHQQDDVHDAV